MMMMMIIIVVIILVMMIKVMIISLNDDEYNLAGIYDVISTYLYISTYHYIGLISIEELKAGLMKILETGGATEDQGIHPSIYFTIIYLDHWYNL
jgi:hypothetical protein